MSKYKGVLNMNNVQIPNFDEYILNNKKNKYCLLIPLFNEGKRFLNQLEKMKSNNVVNMIDIIICDAGSNDESTNPTMLQKSGITALLVRKGKGRQGTDLRMGFYWTMQQGYQGFITVDGNDKDDTSATPLFIEKLDKGYDYIQGSRYISGGRAINTPFIRHLALKLINEPIMSLCARRKLTDTTNGYKGYSLKFLSDKKVQPFREIFYGYELSYYLPVRAARMGFKVIEVPVTREYPSNGEVPTKIGGLKGNLYQLSILYHTIMNHYDPKAY